MEKYTRPTIGHIDRDTIAVVADDHRLLTPKQALTLAAEYVAAAREAQRMTHEEIRDRYDREQARLREEFPEQFAEEADERGDRCTCPMSVRETGRHAVGCPVRDEAVEAGDR
jgi:hypothetical protein